MSCRSRHRGYTRSGRQLPSSRLPPPPCARGLRMPPQPTGSPPARLGQGLGLRESTLPTSSRALVSRCSAAPSRARAVHPLARVEEPAPCMQLPRAALTRSAGSAHRLRQLSPPEAPSQRHRASPPCASSASAPLATFSTSTKRQVSPRMTDRPYGIVIIFENHADLGSWDAVGGGVGGAAFG